MKSIFILGGSKLQLDLIFEAKKLFFHVYLFDANKNCIGQKYADTFYDIDIKNKEKILKYAKNLAPSAVLTIATEIGNTTSCYVSEKLGLNSNSYKTALNTTNKIKMKKICEKHNIKTAKYEIIQNDNTNIEFPCIIKPSDSSAGRGVSYIENKSSLKKAIKKAKIFSQNNKILVEEYIKAKQYSIETISTNKKHKIVAITEEFISDVPVIIETQQLIPARVEKQEKTIIEEFAIKVLKAFDISYGACHIEIKMNSKNELYLIEIASRMGGWRSELINLALGINYTQLLIYSHLNKKINFRNSKEEYAIVKMILNKKDLEEYEKYQEKYPENIISDLKISEIKTSQNLAQSNGYYFLQVQDKKQLKKFIKEHK